MKLRPLVLAFAAVWSSDFHAFSNSSSTCARVITSGGDSSIASLVARRIRPFCRAMSRQAWPTAPRSGK